MKLGNEYNFQEIPQGKCMVNVKLAKRLKLKKHDIVFFLITNPNVMGTTMETFNFLQTSNDTKMNVTKENYIEFVVPFEVYDIYNSSGGKFGDGSLENNIFIEYKYFFNHSGDYYIFYNDSNT